MEEIELRRENMDFCREMEKLFPPLNPIIKMMMEWALINIVVPDSVSSGRQGSQSVRSVSQEQHPQQMQVPHYGGDSARPAISSDGIMESAKGERYEEDSGRNLKYEREVEIFPNGHSGEDNIANHREAGPNNFAGGDSARPVISSNGIMESTKGERYEVESGRKLKSERESEIFPNGYSGEVNFADNREAGQEADKERTAVASLLPKLSVYSHGKGFSCTTTIALIKNGELYVSADGRELYWKSHIYPANQKVGKRNVKTIKKEWPDISRADYQKIIRVSSRVVVTVAGDEEVCRLCINFIRDKINIKNPNEWDVNVAIRAAEEFISNTRWEAYGEAVGAEFLVCGFEGRKPKVCKVGYLNGGSIGTKVIRNNGQYLMSGCGKTHAKTFVGNNLGATKTPKECLELVKLSVAAAALFECSVGGFVTSCIIKKDTDINTMNEEGHAFNIIQDHKDKFQKELQFGVFIMQDIRGKYDENMEREMMLLVRDILPKRHTELDQVLVTLAICLHEEPDDLYSTLHFVKCKNEYEKHKVIESLNKVEKPWDAVTFNASAELPDFGGHALLDIFTNGYREKSIL